MIRQVNQSDEAIPNPLTQLKRQRIQLADFLLENGQPLWPIAELAVYTNPATIIDIHNNSLRNLIHAEQLPAKLEQLQTQYSSNIIPKEKRIQVAKLLLNAHLPLHFPPLSTYRINQQDLQTGVICPSCKTQK